MISFISTQMITTIMGMMGTLFWRYPPSFLFVQNKKYHIPSKPNNVPIMSTHSLQSSLISGGVLKLKRYG